MDRGVAGAGLRAVVALYAPDAVHRSAPFREPHVGRLAIAEYLAWTFGPETAPARVFFAEPMVAGERAVMEWWAEVADADGPATVAGVALAEFDGDGLIVRSRDYWHSEVGHRGPYPDHAALR